MSGAGCRGNGFMTQRHDVVQPKHDSLDKTGTSNNGGLQFVVELCSIRFTSWVEHRDALIRILTTSISIGRRLTTTLLRADWVSQYTATAVV